MNVRPAIFPDDLTAVRALFRQYADGLGVDLSFQNFEEELAGLPGPYVPPLGGIWLAIDNGNLAGCVALRPLTNEAAEMKRLYVRPEFRGSGVGRLLAEQALAAANECGYRRICLDTLPSMASAVELYRSLGFVDRAVLQQPGRGGDVLWQGAEAMKKRFLVRLLLLIALAVGGFALIAWWTAPANITTLERFAKIRGGETPEELEELLGSPGTDKQGLLPIFTGYISVPSGTRVEFADIDAKGLPVGSRWKEWHTGDAKKIVVCFDESGRVAVAARMELVESWPDKIRRWARLGLP